MAAPIDWAATQKMWEERGMTPPAPQPAPAPQAAPVEPIDWTATQRMWAQQNTPQAPTPPPTPGSVDWGEILRQQQSGMKVDLAEPPVVAAPAETQFVGVNGPGQGQAGPVAPQYTPGSPGRMVEAAWTPTAKQYTEHAPGTAEGYLGALDIEYDAASDLAAKDAARASMLADESADVGRRIEEQQAINRQLARQREIQRQQEIDALRKEVAAAGSEKVDPDNYWADKGAGDRIAWAFALAGGAFAEALTGMKNPAEKILDREIANSIDAQKANINNRWKGIADKQNVYAMQLAKWGSDEQAELATVADMQGEMARKIEQAKLEAGSDEAKARLDSLAADFQRKQFQTLDQLNSAQVSARYSPAHMVGGGGGGLANGPQLYIDLVTRRGYTHEQAIAAIASMPGGNKKVATDAAIRSGLPMTGGGEEGGQKRSEYVPALGGYATSSAAAKDASDRHRRLTELLNDYTKVLEIQEDKTNFLPGSKDKAMAEVLSARIINNESLEQEQGVVQEGEAKRKAPLTGANAADLFAVNRAPVFRQRIAEIKTQLAALQKTVSPGAPPAGFTTPASGGESAAATAAFRPVGK